MTAVRWEEKVEVDAGIRVGRVVGETRVKFKCL